jgi:hypothetical protein
MLWVLVVLMVLMPRMPVVLVVPMALIAGRLLGELALMLLLALVLFGWAVLGVMVAVGWYVLLVVLVVDGVGALVVFVCGVVVDVDADVRLLKQSLMFIHCAGAK